MTIPGNVTVRIDWQGGACPYQAEGVLIINGVEYSFYFRFRYDHASMTVWEHGRDSYEDPLFRRDQWDVTESSMNGFMEYDEANAFINRWAEEFVNEHIWYCDECHEVACIFGVPGQPECVCPVCDHVFCSGHLTNHGCYVTP